MDPISFKYTNAPFPSRGAAGDFTATVTGRGVLPRGPDGGCDLSRDPLHEVDMIKATGTLSF
jgi:hypothetical protein